MLSRSGDDSIRRYAPEPRQVSRARSRKRAGKPPLVEVHNPTDREVTTTLRSPDHTPVAGGLTTIVKVPAGDSVRLWFQGKTLEPRRAGA